MISSCILVARAEHIFFIVLEPRSQLLSNSQGISKHMMNSSCYGISTNFNLSLLPSILLFHTVKFLFLSTVSTTVTDSTCCQLCAIWEEKWERLCGLPTSQGLHVSETWYFNADNCAHRCLSTGGLVYDTNVIGITTVLQHKFSHKVKLSLGLTKNRAMKVQLHAFLTSALDGCECLASCSGRFTTTERAPGTHWIGGWVGPRAVLDAVVKRKIPNPRRESNPRTPIAQPVA
jgi:hypothetical protein